MLRDLVFEFGAFEWLDDVRRDTVLSALGEVGSGGCRCKHDYRQISGLRCSADDLEHLKAAELGHYKIEEHQIRPLGLDDPQRVLAVYRLDQCASKRLKCNADQSSDECVVIGDKYRFVLHRGYVHPQRTGFSEAPLQIVIPPWSLDSCRLPLLEFMGRKIDVWCRGKGVCVEINFDRAGVRWGQEVESKEAERREGMHVRALMSQADEGFIALDDGARVRIFNESAEALLGVARSEAKQRTLLELGLSELHQAASDVLECGDAVSIVLETGNRVLSCRATAFCDRKGGGVAIVVRDDTELVMQHERSVAILEGIHDGLVVFAPDGRVTYINPAACEILGVTHEDTVGICTSMRKLLGLESACSQDTNAFPLTEPGADLIGGGGFEEVELSEPVHRILAVRTNAVTDRSGKYLGCVSTLSDVTAEREIAVMKNEFVSMVSHELRTPLTSIKGYVDLILEDAAGSINETQREFLEIVQENSDRLVSLINDLLDISRIESGRVHLKVEPLEMPEVARGVLDTFRTVADKGRVTLEMSASEGLGRAAGDRDRVGQVLMNLVSNAIKYSPGGGSVRVSFSTLDGKVLTEVTDTGIGISEEDQKNLFTKFFRVDSTLTREIGGTGLGLSICKSVVELLGGEIGMHSAEGQGSTFWFTLPVATVDLVRVPSIEGPASAAGVVLVVDSNPEIAELICTFLSNRGYHTCKAFSAEDAVRMAQEIRPSLITLDVVLEDTDGFGLLERLKEDDFCSRIPVLVVSVSCDEGRSLRLGADDYIEKPIDAKQLIQIADALVGQVASPVVLVVDDDRSIVSVLAETLKRRGFAVLSAYDGAEAMAAVKKRSPDLVLLDLMMPVMDGYEVIAALKGAEETSEIPIVVMTAHRIDQLKIDLVEMASDRLAKPILPEQLAEKVEALLLNRSV